MSSVILIEISFVHLQQGNVQIVDDEGLATTRVEVIVARRIVALAIRMSLNRCLQLLEQCGEVAMSDDIAAQ